MPQVDLISDFVERYGREYDYFYEVSRIVSQQCEALASENGIRAIVTFRAKNPDRLESKLRQRHNEKMYETDDDIRADIVDLSGVRIALYFPSDRSKIGYLLNTAFIVDREKKFPDKPKNANSRFDGYHAEHYRIKLKPESLNKTQARYSGSIVEIQVASVLMHAWSEVEHDLSYKQLSGNLSQEEISILDGINGIVLSGEVFLERLQSAFEARVSRTGSTFSNQYELAAYLYDRLRTLIASRESYEPVMGRIDVLFRLLQAAQLDNPEGIAPYLQDIGVDTDRQPLADQVIDQILASKPDLYDIYSGFRQHGTATVRAYYPKKEQPSTDIVGSFLHKWIIFERFVRALSRARNPNFRGGSFPSINILRTLALDTKLVLEMDVLRRIRNNLVHGIVIPEESLLSAADDDLGRILKVLATSDEDDVREAMEWAQSGEQDPQGPRT